MLTVREEVIKLLNELQLPPGESLPGGAARAEIDQLATIIEVPDELAEWLMTCNAPLVGSIEGFYGVPPAKERRLIERQYLLHPEWPAKKWIPIGGDGSGNYYILDNSCRAPGIRPVYFIDHEVDYNEPDYIMASGLWLFLRLILTLEKKGSHRLLFDENYVLEKDPALRNYRGDVPFPWHQI